MKHSIFQRIKTGSLAALLVIFLLMTSQSAAKITEGMAPDFTLKSMGGENIKLSEHRGEVIMINFWASWSGPSREELPLLNELYKRYKSKGFTLFGVNVEDDPAKAKSLLREVQVSFPILVDADNKVSKLYKVDSMPSTIILDRDGNMRYLHNGYVAGYEDEYQKQVRELMRE